MSELVFIRAYSSRFEAEQAQRYLAQQGIDALVQADDAGSMFAGISLGRKGVRLLVRSEDVEAAREALEPGEILDPVVATAPGAGPDAVAAALAAAEQAAAYFAADNNCAESVLRAFAADLGRAAEVVPLATGFGAGFGREGETCGAVSGAIMALGLRYGRLEGGDEDAKERCYRAVRLLVQRFRETHGTLVCRELTGVDLLTDVGQRRYEDEDVFHQVCSECVRTAASLAATLLAED